MSIFRKIGRILLLVGGILELLSMGLAFLLAIGAFVVAALGETILPDNAALLLGVGIGGGILLLIAAVICLIAGIIGIKGFKAHTKGNYIANIVFGVLSWSIFLLAGGVLGLLALRKEKKEQQAEEQPVEEAAE